MASPRIIMKLTVTAAHKEPGDVLVIEVKHPRKPLLPPFEPGSHVDIICPMGRCASTRSAVIRRTCAATRSR